MYEHSAMKYYARDLKVQLTSEVQRLRDRIKSQHNQIATFCMSTMEEIKKMRTAIKTKEDKRVSYDYYRNKMGGLEKTHKEVEDPKKREKWLKNVGKQTDANREYQKACNDLSDMLTLLEERAKVTCD